MHPTPYPPSSPQLSQTSTYPARVCLKPASSTAHDLFPYFGKGISSGFQRRLGWFRRENRLTVSEYSSSIANNEASLDFPDLFQRISYQFFVKKLMKKFVLKVERCEPAESPLGKGKIDVIVVGIHTRGWQR
ncbi:hypothetical protein AAMO2058_000651100 [Amorphochlora amoebiformis]